MTRSLFRLPRGLGYRGPTVEAFAEDPWPRARGYAADDSSNRRSFWKRLPFLVKLMAWQAAALFGVVVAAAGWLIWGALTWRPPG